MMMEQREQDTANSSDTLHQKPVTTPQTTAAAEGAVDGKNNISKMKWRKGKDALEPMKRGAVVVLDKAAYFRPHDSIHVYGYQYSYQDVEGDEAWYVLPDNLNKDCGLVVIDGRLTSVGGNEEDHSKPTSALLTLTLDLSSVRHEAGGLGGKGEMKEWTEILPPMQTPRSESACITTKHCLVVAGGLSKNGIITDNVEVMDINTKQWRSVAHLPNKYYDLSAAICGDRLYLAGGITPRDNSHATKSVFTCSLTDLFNSNNSIGSRLLRTVSPNRAATRVWNEAASLPGKYSTLITFNHHVVATTDDDNNDDLLLAVGGLLDSSEKETTAVYRYDAHTDSWSVISNMPTKRYSTLAVNLEGRLIVVGGVYCYLRLHSNDLVEILDHHPPPPQ